MGADHGGASRPPIHYDRSMSLNRLVRLLLVLTLGLGAPWPAFPATPGADSVSADMGQMHDCCAETPASPCPRHHQGGCAHCPCSASTAMLPSHPQPLRPARTGEPPFPSLRDVAIVPPPASAPFRPPRV